VSRALGPEGRGSVAIFTILQLFGSLGFGAGTGAAAYVRASRDPDSRHVLVGVILVWFIAVFLGTCLAASVALGFGWLGQWIHGAALPLVGLVALGAAAQYTVTTSVLIAMGLGRGLTTALGFAVAPVMVVVGNAAAALNSSDPMAFILVQSLAWSAAAGVLLVALRIRPRFNGRAVREIAAAGRAAWLADIANALSYRLDTLLLGLIVGAYAVGIYSFAVQLLEPIWMIATAVATGFLIEYRSDRLAEQQRRLIRSTVLVIGATAVGIGILLAALPFIISAVGRSFEGAFPAALLLAPGILFLAASKVLAAHQLAAGRLWLGSLIAGLSLLITTAGDLALMQPLGAAGASIASSLGYGVSAVLWFAAYRRYRASTQPATAGPTVR